VGAPVTIVAERGGEGEGHDRHGRVSQKLHGHSHYVETLLCHDKALGNDNALEEEDT